VWLITVMCVTTAAVTVQHNDFGPLSFQVIIFNYTCIRDLRQHNAYKSQSESLNKLKVNTFHLRAFNNGHSSLGGPGSSVGIATELRAG
jgi:hypothetical protein